MSSRLSKITIAIAAVLLAAGLAAIAEGRGASPAPSAPASSTLASAHAAVVTPPALSAALPSAYEAAIHISRKIGSRPAGGRSERRVHAYAAAQFETAGLKVSVKPFRVPGRGRSRNVIGELDGSEDCLLILMAHTDSVPPGLGANDNASGVGVLVALARRVAALGPGCDVWLVATGAEERVVIGTGYHVGAAALVKTVRQRGRAQDLRFALSVDMVGRGRKFYLRSPVSGVRSAVEGQVLAAANRANVRVNWERDSGTGNSDHREFELAGLPGAVIEVWQGMDACHHEACDRPGRLEPAAHRRVQRVLEELISAA